MKLILISKKWKTRFMILSEYINKVDEDFINNYIFSFFTHPFIIKIDEFIEHGAHFGAIKEWIQKNCVDVPVPTRRDPRMFRCY